jgi:prevent-host-death family protein
MSHHDLMARQVNLREAKSQLSDLVEQAAAGAEIVITSGGKPKARLGPLPSRKPERRPGGGKGKVTIAADFDARLPPEIHSQQPGCIEV